MTTGTASPRLVVLSCCLGMLAIGINGTAIMTALPTIRRDLALDAGHVAWAVNAYLVAAAACVMLGGAITDRIGAARASVAGLLLFALASAVIALARDADVLLAGRALQGLGAALSIPSTLAAISTASPPERRAGAIGAWAGTLMLGFSIGPLIGGILTHLAGWRVIFWADGTAIVLAACGLWFAGPTRPPVPTVRPHRFDGLGFVSLAAAMVATIFALQGLAHIGQAPLRLAVPLGFALLAFALFVRQERRCTGPLVDFGLFTTRGFKPALIIATTAMSCILPLLLFFNLDAQRPDGLGLSAIGAGGLLLPMSAGLLAFALLAPRLAARFGVRQTIGAALLVVAVAALAVAWAFGARALPLLGVGLFCLGAGLAVPYAIAPRLALAEIPGPQAGQGSGIVNSCTLLGGSIGVTLGAVAFGEDGFARVMLLLALAALIGLLAAARLPSARPVATGKP
ncbi:MFS transporter [Methylobacterium pseudosasicola]|uniref:Predicted arabinose efflux permease, MFS family n=1 Tax=Methylobacterium pseudosasicola TaxID=582667 RepID=A0A1I4S0K3_9HYPH|nr:MFS transporter [Methylobacterium pseudosasicola]SFM58048.1 Predicted arabinose efflux permease, MFS family [Methylobacterium pseudosasicola]